MKTPSLTASHVIRSVLSAALRAIVLAAAASTVFAAQTPESPGDAFQARAERFQSQLDALCKKHDLPGATAAFILPDGRHAGFASGYAYREERIRMTPDSRLLSGSIGKTFVSAVVLSLHQEGKLNLDDKIARWLGEEPWFKRLPNGEDITLRHLLTHSGGLIDHVYDLRFAVAIRQRLAAENPDRDWAFSPRDQIEFALDRPPLFPAGEGYSYTDTGYLIAGLVIERASGSSYYDELQQRFLTPLQLTRTGPANQRNIPGLAAGYLAANNLLGLPTKTMEQGVMVFNPAAEWTGGGLAASSQDLVRWGQTLYEGRALEKPYLHDLLESGFRAPDKEGHYGLGVYISKTLLGTVYGHGGWFPGYRSRLAYFPEHKTAIAVQVNTDVVEDLDSDFQALARIALDK